MRTAAALLTLLLGAALPVVAQDSSATADSLRERLDRAEEAIERLQRQLDEQSQSKVGSRLLNRVTLSGLVVTNGFYNSARVNNADVPQFVEPPDTTGLPQHGLGAAVRQSRLGVTVSGLRVLGADAVTDLQLDFFGGQQPSPNGRTSPLLRVRTAIVQLDWASTSLMIGQEMPLVSPHNPVSLAASGVVGYATAGNLWLWIPQVRVGWHSAGPLRVGVQTAALAPMTPTPQGLFATQADAAERSGRPSLEARLFLGWGEGDAESQFGVGAHYGWIATPGDTAIASRALTLDWRLALGETVQLLGEAFLDAQAVGGLGGGGIGQNLGPAGQPVRTTGGWAQLNIRPSLMWELGAGAGVDDPDDADLPVSGRLRNVALSGHLHWRPGGGLLFGLAVQRIETTYAGGKQAGTHVNLAAGMAF